MIEEIAAWVRESALSPIVEATYDGFNLSVGGDNWGFGTTSPWRVVEQDNLVASWADVDVARRALNSMIGCSLLSVRAQSRETACDPVLALSSGQMVEVFSDTPIDPWIFVVPGMTYVGTPADQRYR